MLGDCLARGGVKPFSGKFPWIPVTGEVHRERTTRRRIDQVLRSGHRQAESGGRQFGMRAYPCKVQFPGISQDVAKVVAKVVIPRMRCLTDTICRISAQIPLLPQKR